MDMMRVFVDFKRWCGDCYGRQRPRFGKTGHQGLMLGISFIIRLFVLNIYIQAQKLKRETNVLE